jgi:3-oxoacyl-[acyl-carrier protein] reductase
MPTLTDKKALVTGGSRGIGAGMVRKLAEQGADVAFTYKSNSKAATAVTEDIEATGRRVLAIEADSSVPDRLTGAVAQTLAITSTGPCTLWSISACSGFSF